MPNLRLHDHGWLALPAELREQLGLRTGDRLQLEIIDGGLRLRLTGQAAPEVAQPAPPQAVSDEPVAKRGRGRPRKQLQADPPVVQPQETAAAAGKRVTRSLLPKLKVGGRRKSEPVGTA